MMRFSVSLAGLAALLAACASPPVSAEPPATPVVADAQTPDPAALAELADYRASIDNIDAAILRLMAERFRVTEAVGELKARSALPPKDPAREAVQVARKRALAAEAGLDPDFAEALHHFVVSAVIGRHEEIREGQE